MSTRANALAWTVFDTRSDRRALQQIQPRFDSLCSIPMYFFAQRPKAVLPFTSTVASRLLSPQIQPLVKGFTVAISGTLTVCCIYALSTAIIPARCASATSSRKRLNCWRFPETFWTGDTSTADQRQSRFIGYKRSGPVENADDCRNQPRDVVGIGFGSGWPA
jgi:hypothetical protein